MNLQNSGLQKKTRDIAKKRKITEVRGAEMKDRNHPQNFKCGDWKLKWQQKKRKEKECKKLNF